MLGRKVAFYYAWSRPAEVGAPVEVNENRFPTLYESRRLSYPRYQEFSDPRRFDQGIGGFLDHIMKPNFHAFMEQTAEQTGIPVIEIERVDETGVQAPLSERLLTDFDMLIVIGFDSLRTAQSASSSEVAAVRAFLNNTDRTVFICPHHDIGAPEGVAEAATEIAQEAEFHHHGDRSIPSQQRFGGFARSLLAGLELPVENRFGLRPAIAPDGSPAPLLINGAADRRNLLAGVQTFNMHAHLPHLHCLGPAASGLEVLARQSVDPSAPPHRFVQEGHSTFNALLQSRPDLFAGDLLVSDATLWSGTAGGLTSLRRFWTNVIQRSVRSPV